MLVRNFLSIENWGAGSSVRLFDQGPQLWVATRKKQIVEEFEISVCQIANSHRFFGIADYETKSLFYKPQAEADKHSIWRGTFFTLLLDSWWLWGGEGEFLIGVFWGLDEGCVGEVTSRSEGGDCITVTTGGGEMEADVEGKGSDCTSGSKGVTLKVLGGVCFGVVIFALIDGNIVLVLGFLHPCATPSY